jgi:hypothetical protein
MVGGAELVVYAEADQSILFGAGAEPLDDEDDELSKAELAAYVTPG